MAKKTFKGNTHIMVVLDESGSMNMIYDDTIGGYNAWLADAQTAENADKTFLTLVKFDTVYRMLEANVPLSEAKPLDKSRYQPRGATALYDAIGHAVNLTESLVGKKDRALVLIITDGEENSSKEMTNSSTRALIEEHEKRGNWTFTYQSASYDAFADAGAIGIGRGNTMAFAPTAQGMTHATVTRSSSTRAFLGGARGQSASFYAGDKDEDEDEWGQPKNTSGWQQSPRSST